MHRKEQQIRCCLEKNVESSQTTGLERYCLVNQALPETAFADVSATTSFLGKKVLAPFIISPMTGGVEISKKINKNLAKTAQDLGVVMCVGSQKLALEDPSLIPTFQVRDVAPEIPLLANLSALYLNYGYGLDECKRAVEMIEADGLVLYLNPLQRILRGMIDSDFKGITKKISKVCRTLEVPVIVKEIGFGLSASAAVMLQEAGVSMLDVAGAGGTSWAKIERYMKQLDDPADDFDRFDDWGISTASSLVSVLQVVKETPVVASGGIRSGLDMAKAIALGASYVGMALPLLAPAMESHEAVKKKIQRVIHEFKIALFCCGKKGVDEFKQGSCVNEMKR